MGHQPCGLIISDFQDPLHLGIMRNYA
jgi:hypothetical protein